MDIFETVVAFLVIIIIGLIGGLIYWKIRLGYEYDKVIGAYIENAYEVNTPDEMIKQVNLAIEGMKKEGLTPDLYGALVFKKPSNTMEWQYKFLDNFIERAEAVEEWKQKTYSEGSQSTETMGDVYEEKMDNLREFIKEGGNADWIAKDAWYIKKIGWWKIIIKL